MEKEIDHSVFNILERNNLVTLSQIFNASTSYDNRFAGKGQKEIWENKILGRLYDLAESLIGKDSLSLINDEDLLLRSFAKPIQILKQEGIAESFFLNGFRYNDAPSFYGARVEQKNIKESTDGIPVQRSMGNAFGKNPADVFSKAIGEFLERYSLAIYRKENFIKISADYLKRKKIDYIPLEDLNIFSEEQKKRNPAFNWTNKDEFYFCRVFRYSTNKEYLIPAQLVFWNYQEKNEPILRESNTNGNAGMFTKTGAILSGLYESIERDSFLIFWLNRISPLRIAVDTIPDKNFQEILQQSRRYGFLMHVFNTTLESGVPSFIAVIEDTTNHEPCYAFGGGAGKNPLEALNRAVEEAWAIYYKLRREEKTYILPSEYIPFDDSTIGREERLRLWATRAMKKELEFFLRGEERKFSEIEFGMPSQFAREEDELSYLVKRIEDLGPGYEVYYYNSKFPILSKLNYFSTKVIVPKLTPLYLQEIKAPLGSWRWQNMPDSPLFSWGHGPNLLPHPFP